ncbi:MAG TPA: D-glycerate dehydrogenase [Kofleriaceae bacterium]|nr:D-glycerate dehydrogenase [Kofleriaceae bacterium]
MVFSLSRALVISSILLVVRIVSTSSLPIDLAAQVTAQLPDAIVEVPTSKEQWIGVERCDLSTADALVCLLLDKIDGSVIARAPKLRVIANCAVGYDNVDVAAATRAGIAVTNTPDVLTDATAEFTIALMFAAARRLPEGEALVRSGGWIGWRLDQLLGQPIRGRTLGIVGMGRIGQAVAARAAALGMHILYAEPHDVATPFPARRVPVDDLFGQADVVSLHCPLTSETRHLVNAERLARMKPTAILLNTARGGCVDDRALADALQTGRIAAAGLDVFDGEPAIDACLLAAPHLVLAPHLGSATTRARTQMAQLCADAVLSVLTGKRPTNLVNREVVLRG